MSKSVILAGEGAPLEILPDHVYFTFPSGVYGYDCHTCNAKCCRGFGYNAQAAREFTHQVSARPAIRFFVDRPHPERECLQVSNCPPSCFFLTTGGQCGVEREHGHAAKPETCRLFPFNNFRRVGSYLIVGPHSGLCPLAVVSPPDLAPASSYDHLLEEMALHGIASRVPVAARVEKDLGALIDLERAIVGSSQRFLALAPADFIGLAVEQVDATRAAFGRRSANGRDAEEQLRQYRTLLCDVLGIRKEEASLKNEEVDRVMIATTPFFRSLLAFPIRQDGRDVEELGLDRIPYLLLGLHTLVTLAADAGMTEITFQSVSALFGKQRELLALLALLDANVKWHSDAAAPLVFPGNPQTQAGYLRLLKALVDTRNGASGVPLGAMLCENLPRDGLERVIFLRNVAARLSGRVAVVSDGRKQRRNPRRASRAGIYHFLVSRLSDDLLIALAERRASKERAARSQSKVTTA